MEETCSSKRHSINITGTSINIKTTAFLSREYTLTIYHGSPQIIETPELSKGKPNNDYGRGFYCTESMELAKEWACSSETDGFANRYDFDQTHLSVLNLSGGKYHILNWLSILFENRTFRISGDIAQRAHEYIIQHFMIEYKFIISGTVV